MAKVDDAIRALTSPDANTRAKAIKYLAQQGDARALDALQQTADFDTDERIREFAAQAYDQLAAALDTATADDEFDIFDDPFDEQQPKAYDAFDEDLGLDSGPGWATAPDPEKAKNDDEKRMSWGNLALSLIMYALVIGTMGTILLLAGQSRLVTLLEAFVANPEPYLAILESPEIDAMTAEDISFLQQEVRTLIDELNVSTSQVVTAGITSGISALVGLVIFDSMVHLCAVWFGRARRGWTTTVGNLATFESVLDGVSGTILILTLISLPMTISAYQGEAIYQTLTPAVLVLTVGAVVYFLVWIIGRTIVLARAQDIGGGPAFLALIAPMFVFMCGSCFLQAALGSMVAALPI